MDDGVLREVPVWQRLAADCITRPGELLEYLELDAALPQLAYEACRHFPLRVPRGFVARMRKGDPLDPLFLQVWPAPAEAEEVPGFQFDAVGDLQRVAGRGVIHKYQGRVLLIATGACAVHCRYCFRRHFPYSDTTAARAHWKEALETIAADEGIEEVILSGGDPLSLSDDKLTALVQELAAIAHVKRLRVHTRLPIVIPERVDDKLLGWLTGTRLRPVVVVHANHSNELDGSVRNALGRLHRAGVPLLNQSVLLRNVNDDAQILASLSLDLFNCVVFPYYLHALDRVHGAAHFEVADARARLIMRELNQRLPGYLVPRLVREEPGAPGKSPMPW